MTSALQENVCWYGVGSQGSELDNKLYLTYHSGRPLCLCSRDIGRSPECDSKMSIPDLPNPAEWQPRDSATETLQSAFLKRCVAVERLIGLRTQSEREMNIDNFDSGIGVEDILREELAKILPSRYNVERGVLVDRDGKTGGDYEIIVFNEAWFPRVKAGASDLSRRSYYPIEGVYAVGEVKQTLVYATLDSVMKKLVLAHRLFRPPTFAKRLVENRESGACKHGLSNPLYSFVLATGLADKVSLESLIDRFYDISKQLKRLEVIRALCVLGHGTVIWSFRDRVHGGLTPALFMLDDPYEPIVPAYFHVDDVTSALFALVSNLMLHLFESVLAPEDIPALYGTANRKVKGPKSDEIALQPDQDQVESLKTICKHDE